MSKRAPSSWIAAAAALLTLVAVTGGCAGPGAERGRPAASFGELFGAAPEIRTLRADADVTVTLRGHDVSLPGAVLLDAGGHFRIELLDPLDRPALVLFDRGEDLAQYRPAEAAAAIMRPYPPGCAAAGTGRWVGRVLGAADAAGRYRARSFFGREYLELFRFGALVERIRYDREEGRAAPREDTWFCDDSPVLRLRLEGGRLLGGRRYPASFTVEFPRMFLSVTVRFGEIEANPALERDFFSFDPPPGTSWRVYDAAAGP